MFAFLSGLRPLCRCGWAAALAGALGVCGCGESAAPARPEIPVAPAAEKSTPDSGHQAETKSAAADQGSTEGSAAPREVEIAGIKFRVPANWKRVELTPQQQGFIDARFEIPVGDATLQLTCSSTGGGREANIQRWIRQFRLPAGEQPHTEPLTIDGAEATWVDLSGTFDTRMPGSAGPQENWRMLGVALDAGEQDFYLKLTGPREAVGKAHDEFREFAKSARLP